MKTLNVTTRKKEEFVIITDLIQKAVDEIGIQDGLCMIFTPHTTAGLTINENADPDVRRDMALAVQTIVPENLDYKHYEENSPAHLKSSLFGCSEQLMVEEGKLVLGTWQGVYFCEFDGPRQRNVIVKVISA